MDLTGRSAVVTGAGSGIGKAIARQLAENGAEVAVNDIDAEKGAESAAAIRGGNGRAVFIQADIATWEGARRLMEKTGEAFGKIDILVNNAGITIDKVLKKMEASDWDRVLDINLKGAFNCCRHAVPKMIERKYGKIVNISSRAHLGNPGQANYAASKAGLIGLTRSLALELGRYRINVNAVAPGMIDTEGLRRHPKYEMIVETALQKTPLNRIGTPEDVARLVHFLVSDFAGYITGEVVHITGGRY